MIPDDTYEVADYYSYEANHCDGAWFFTQEQRTHEECLSYCDCYSLE